MAEQMDLADKGLLIYLLRNYKYTVEHKIKVLRGFNLPNDIKRMELELEMIDRVSSCSNNFM